MWTANGLHFPSVKMFVQSILCQEVDKMLLSSLDKYFIYKYSNDYLVGFEVVKDYANNSPWILCRKDKST